MMMNLIAEITTGGTFPDGKPLEQPQRVMYLKPIWHQFINRYLQSLRHIKQRLYSHFDLSGFISGNGFVGATSSKFFSKSILRHVFLFANLLDLLTNKFRV